MRGITGRLRMVCEPGTIVGPDNIGEYHVALECEHGVTSFAYATVKDIETALAVDTPRSVTEMRLRQTPAYSRYVKR